MKECAICQIENQDNANFCKSCRTEFEKIRIPVLDRYPGINFRPTTDFNDRYTPLYQFQKRFDYIEDPDRNNKKEIYHRLIKDGKFGVCLWKRGFLGLILGENRTLIECEYDYLEFIDNRFKGIKGGITYFIDKTGSLLK